MNFFIVIGAILGAAFGGLTGALIGGALGYIVVNTLLRSVVGSLRVGQSQLIDATFAVMGAVIGGLLWPTA